MASVTYGKCIMASVIMANVFGKCNWALQQTNSWRYKNEDNSLKMFVIKVYY